MLDFRAQLSDLREETRRSDTGRRVFRFTRPWHYAASAALALLVAIGLATVLGRPLSNSDLFVKYMKPYELVLTNRAMEDDIIKVTMSWAENAYLEADYENAIIWYSEVLEMNQEKIEAWLSTDELTGLANRREFERVSAEATEEIDFVDLGVFVDRDDVASDDLLDEVEDAKTLIGLLRLAPHLLVLQVDCGVAHAQLVLLQEVADHQPQEGQRGEGTLQEAANVSGGGNLEDFLNNLEKKIRERLGIGEPEVTTLALCEEGGLDPNCDNNQDPVKIQ